MSEVPQINLRRVQNRRESGSSIPAQRIIVQNDTADTAVLGQGTRLRLDLLSGEDTRNQVRVVGHGSSVRDSGELLDTIDVTTTLDLHGDQI